MKTDKRIKHKIIAIINTIIPSTLDHVVILPVICVTIPTTILENIRREVPLVIPFSVIISPRNIIIIAHTASTKAANKTVGKEVSIIPPKIEFIKNTIPID